MSSSWWDLVVQIPTKTGLTNPSGQLPLVEQSIESP